ncbi:MAG: hypothetical protein P1V81_10880 [Planctomycetota bacterium]|nr:hypothetical protein [Planctomycetota bacterium]
MQSAAPQDLALDFDSAEELAGFLVTDEAMWRVHEGSLELLGKGAYQPPHRSPHSIALLRTPDLGDFVLEVDLLQTGHEYGHRDLCLVFGHQDPANFYYVHLATTPDPNAHNVFVVDDADRRPLLPVPAVGVDWGTGRWHHARLERTGARVSLHFDGDLVHEVEDGTHGAGRIGLGSFDDQGRFDRLRLSSPDLPAGVGDGCDL